MAPRRRLDSELVRRGLAASRAQAVELIEAGQVLVSGAVAERPSRLVADHDPVVLAGPKPRFVGRGGEKLAPALDRFGIDPTGKSCVDVGSSTGGFTDCLLQRGAQGVVAVDVGYGQLHERLRADPRVRVRERTNIREATTEDLGGPFDLVTADLSFISLRTVARSLADLARPAGDLLVLIKPQFEAGRQEASKGRGVIRDPAVWKAALLGAIAALEDAGAAMMGVMVSPLRGADGNVEFFAHLRRESAQVTPRGSVEEAIDQLVAETAKAGS